MSNFFNPLENFSTFYNMQSVSSNAVALALGGTKIKKYTTSVSIAPAHPDNSYISFSPPADMVFNTSGNNNVIGFTASTAEVAVSKGMTINLRWANEGNGYFTYIKPYGIADTVTFFITIYYLV